MLKRIWTLFFILGTSSAFACDNFEGYSVYGHEIDSPIEIFQNKEINPAKKALFINNPVFTQDMYESCKDALALISFIDKDTKKVYHAVASHEDHCDGGNTIGVIYNSKGSIVGEIGDSEMYCY